SGRHPGPPLGHGRARPAGPGRAAPGPVLPARGRPAARRRLPGSGRLTMRHLRPVKELNQVEQWKLERHPLDVRDAVVDRYAREGPEAIKTVPGEVERLKWVGLYPQRQGGDAFMLRIKVPGGRLDAAKAEVIGGIADEFARGPAPNPVFGDAYLDITTRQDIQLHWVRIGAVPEIWSRLEAVGMTTVQACGDSARNVL